MTPRLNKAKSYFTGSVGSIFLKALSSSTTALWSFCFRFNKPKDLAVLSGTSSEDANWVFIINNDGTGAVLNTLRSQDINGFTKWTNGNTNNFSFTISSGTPVLNNSYTKNLNYSIGTSYIGDFGFIGTSYRRFELDYGVPGGFVGAHPNGVDIEMTRYQNNIKIIIELSRVRPPTYMIVILFYP